MNGTGNGKGGTLQSDLKALRASKSFSLRDLENMTGIPRGAISRAERGKETPFCDEIDKLEAALGTRPTWFIEVDPPERILEKR